MSYQNQPPTRRLPRIVPGAEGLVAPEPTALDAGGDGTGVFVPEPPFAQPSEAEVREANALHERPARRTERPDRPRRPPSGSRPTHGSRHAAQPAPRAPERPQNPDDPPRAEPAARPEPQRAAAPPSEAPGARSFGRSSLIMSLGTLVSRLLGFVKAVVLITAIGVAAGGSADAFDVANKIPNNLYMLIAGGVLNAVLVPQLVRAAKHPDGGKQYTDRLLTGSIGVLAILTVVLTLASPVFIWIYAAPTWPPEQVELALAFAYLCVPQVFFYGLYTMLGQVLNAKGLFGAYMWAPVMNNLIAIAGLVAFIGVYGSGRSGGLTVLDWTPNMIVLLAGSATLGVVAQAFILFLPLRRAGFSFRPSFQFRNMGLRRAGTVASWTFAAVLLGQFAYIFTSRASTSVSSTSTDVVASSAAQSTAYLIFMLPHSIAAVSIATSLFTPLASYAANHQFAEIQATVAKGLRIITLISVLATAGLVVLGRDIGIMLARGTTEGEALGMVIITMGLGLVPFSGQYMLQRVFYAFEDARTPFYIAIPSAAITILGSFAAMALPDYYTVAGIGLVMTASYTVGFALTALILRGKIGPYGLGDLVSSFIRLTIAGLAAGIAGLVARHVLETTNVLRFGADISALSLVLFAGIVMVVVYVVVAYVLRAREITELVAMLRRRVRR